MKKIMLKKTLMASLLMFAGTVLSIAGMGVSGVDAHAQTKVDASDNSQQKINAFAKEELNVWLQGLEEAAPQYQLKLAEYTDKGAYTQVVVDITQTIRMAPYTEIEPLTWQYKFKIKQGLNTENGLLSIAMVDGFEGVYPNSELQALSQRLQSGQNGLLHIQPSGNLYMKSTSGKPIEVDLGYGQLIFIPSFDSLITANKKEGLANLTGSVPQITFKNSNPATETRLVFNGVKWAQKNKPIRTDLYAYNGETEIRIADVNLFEGSRNQLNVSDLKYKEVSKVDGKGLLQGKLSLSFSGSEIIISEYVLKKEEPSANLFQVDVAGEIKNYQTKWINVSGMEFFNRLLRYYPPTTEEEAALIDILSYGPELNMHKVAITFNKSVGNFSLNLRHKPFDKANVHGKELGEVVLQGAQVHFSMDIPQDWLNAFYTEEDDAKRKKMLENVEEETSGVVVKHKNRLRTDFSYKDGKMTLNGKEVENPFLKFLF